MAGLSSVVVLTPSLSHSCQSQANRDSEELGSNVVNRRGETSGDTPCTQYSNRYNSYRLHARSDTAKCYLSMRALQEGRQLESITGHDSVFWSLYGLVL